MIKIFSNWLKLNIAKIEYDGNKNINIIVDDSDEIYNLNNINDINIIILAEPRAINNHKYDFVIKNINYYDIILSYDDELLKFSNCYKLLFGTSWIDCNQSYNKKENIISFLIGGKNMTIGHKIRNNLYLNSKLIENKLDIYLSNNFPPSIILENVKYLVNDKNDFFTKYKYHLCIENSKQINYFTEKIIDCFNSMTVPIYWGCPNIAEYFDINGIIILKSNDVLDIITEINAINIKDFYDKNFFYIKKNFELCKNYIDYPNNIIKTLNSNKLLVGKFKKTLYFFHIPKCGGTSVVESLLNIFPVELKNKINGQEKNDDGDIYEWYKLPKNEIIEYVKNRNIIINEDFFYNSFITEIFNIVIIIRNPIHRFLSHCNMLYKNNKEFNNCSFDDYVVNKINLDNFHLAYNLINCINMNSNYKNEDNVKLFFYKLKNSKLFYIEDINFNEKITNYFKRYFNKDFLMCHENKNLNKFNVSEEVFKFIENKFEEDVFYYNEIIKKYCD
jgi:hypothetical protein